MQISLGLYKNMMSWERGGRGVRSKASASAFLLSPQTILQETEENVKTQGEAHTLVASQDMLLLTAAYHCILK